MLGFFSFPLPGCLDDAGCCRPVLMESDLHLSDITDFINTRVFCHLNFIWEDTCCTIMIKYSEYELISILKNPKSVHSECVYFLQNFTQMSRVRVHCIGPHRDIRTITITQTPRQIPTGNITEIFLDLEDLSTTWGWHHLSARSNPACIIWLLTCFFLIIIIIVSLLHVATRNDIFIS